MTKGRTDRDWQRLVDDRRRRNMRDLDGLDYQELWREFQAALQIPKDRDCSLAEAV